MLLFEYGNVGESASACVSLQTGAESCYAAPRASNVSNSLLQRVANGETQAVAACIDQYGALVWSLARRLLGNPSEAEDAVQEVFIEIWKHAGRFDPAIASETTFVAMIARRRLIDRRRRDNRRLDTEAFPIEQAASLTVGDGQPLDMQDEAARATEVLKQLKPEQRNVLQLAVCQGWPHQLIADRLGLPLGTVKTHVRRGLQRIREELESAENASTKEATP